MRGITRRHLLEGMAGALTAQGLAAGAVQSSSKARSKYSLPGLYRGRVVAAEHAVEIEHCFQGVVTGVSKLIANRAELLPLCRVVSPR